MSGTPCFLGTWQFMLNFTWVVIQAIESSIHVKVNSYMLAWHSTEEIISFTIQGVHKYPPSTKLWIIVNHDRCCLSKWEVQQWIQEVSQFLTWKGSWLLSIHPNTLSVYPHNFLYYLIVNYKLNTIFFSFSQVSISFLYRCQFALFIIYASRRILFFF